MNESTQSQNEEIANSVSHGMALLAALIVMPILIVASNRHGIATLIGTSVYSFTMVLLYLTSTLYHALPVSRAKRVILKLDHGAIYLFIAGSYTPFALQTPLHLCGWILLVAVWLLAILGIALKVFGLLSPQWLSTGLYLAMGWLVLAAAVPLAEQMPAQVDVWLVTGGLAYTVGVVFFMLDSRMKYAHTVWHGFVVLGTACHFFAVLSYPL